ncbi:kinase-like domain-containing protein [Dichotomocladium elegans]|nr:kinase-like domain-containing protein [Dichotomocladium elegans]
MGFAGNPNLYCYFHENGPDPDMPLSSQDLMYLCSIADHSANQRILVSLVSECPTPAQHQHYRPPWSSYSHQRMSDTPTYDLHLQDALYGNSTYSLSTPELGHSPSETPLSPYLQSFHNAEIGPDGLTSVFFPSSTPHDEPVGIQLSDPPTPCYSDENHPLFKNEDNGMHCLPSAIAMPSEYRRQRTGSAPYIHDSSSSAVAKAAKAWTRRSEPGFDRPYQTPLNADALWAVPPKQKCEATARTTALSGVDACQVQQQSPTMDSPKAATPAIELWAVPPPHVPVHPLQRHDGTMHEESSGSDPQYLLPEAPVSPLSPHDYWGERPPAEIVCQNMDKYFTNHDLDKEILVEDPIPLPPTASTSVQPQQPNMVRRLTHTKSIRVVAREASKKYNKARKASAALGHNNSRFGVNDHGQVAVMRRKSTKLWGQRVVEVKPDEAPMSPLNEQEYSMRLTDQNGETKLVQWIRGKLLGKGSFGRVYLAFNVATREVIAVKQVEIPKTRSDLLDSHRHDMVDALYQEIAMLRDLDHDNIVQYLGYGKDDQEEVVNIFLEYVSGGSIASRLALHGAFEESLVRYFTHQILLGLEYLHARGILHRDIKAANILVEADGVCKISDFGLSKKNDYDEAYDQNSRMSLRGSVYWMAPEVVKNQPYSAKVDIWSLGCTVIEMFTGQRPWLTLNQIAALYNLGCQKSPQVPENISKDAHDFLSACFTIDPNKRPTAAELLEHRFCRPDPLFEFTVSSCIN